MTVYEESIEARGDTALSLSLLFDFLLMSRGFHGSRRCRSTGRGAGSEQDMSVPDEFDP